MEEAMNKLAQYFPSLDRAFLEDVYVSTNKDFDKTGMTICSCISYISHIIFSPPTKQEFSHTLSYL